MIVKIPDWAGDTMLLQFVKNSATFWSSQSLNPAARAFKIFYYINQLVDILNGYQRLAYLLLFYKRIVAATSPAVEDKRETIRGVRIGCAGLEANCNGCNRAEIEQQ